MSATSARRTPNPAGDYIRDLIDYSPKDSTDTMEHPCCSLSKRKRLKPIERKTPDGKVWIKITPHPEHGMATIWDFDILIFCISRIAARKSLGDNQALDGTIYTTPHEILRGIARGVSKKDYIALEESLKRLATTTVETNIRADKKAKVAVFQWLNFEAEGKDDPTAPKSSITIKLPHWLLEGIQAGKIVTLDRAYFQLSGGTERALYRVARKHAGNQPAGWTCRVSLLHEKIGSEGPLKQFTYALRKLVTDDTRRTEFPQYHMTLTQTASGEDAVHFVDRIYLDAKKAKEHQAALVRRFREDARAAWLDRGRHPREFDAAYDAWCDRGNHPADFEDSLPQAGQLF